MSSFYTYPLANPSLGNTHVGLITSYAYLDFHQPMPRPTTASPIYPYVAPYPYYMHAFHITTASPEPMPQQPIPPLPIPPQ